MREAIGGTAIFQIVIFFILLFTGFICLSINNSKAYNAKNMIINTVERNGVDLNNTDSDGTIKDSAIREIVEYLKKVSYRTTGSCSTGFDGITRDGKNDFTGRNSAFCIKKESVGGNTGMELPSMGYYRIEVFYQLDLPIFRSTFNFRVSGDTKIMYKTVHKNKVDSTNWEGRGA